MSMMTAVSDLDYYNETNPDQFTEAEDNGDCTCGVPYGEDHQEGCPERREGPNAEARRHESHESDRWNDDVCF